MGEEDEALYDCGVDRFREPGDFSRATGSNAEALGHWLQALQGSSGSMAKNSQHGSTGGQLSASWLFDSFLQPTLAGTRSTSLGTRQMLYRADPYQIDIQIEAKPEGNRLMVTGQLLDVSSPGIVGRNVNITLSNHRGNLIRTVTNQFGEFRGEIENSGDLELSFPGKGEKSIVISLRNALGNLHGSKA